MTESSTKSPARSEAHNVAKAPPKLCYFTRFCPDYGDPAERYADALRDADDPARALYDGRSWSSWAAARIDLVTAFARRSA